MKFLKLFSLLSPLSSLLFITTPMQAQKKLFTLEELNYGGTNYHQVVPENKYYTWWGDELVRTDVEECYLVDKKTGTRSHRCGGVLSRR